MAKQPFRSIGQRLRTLARSHISTYLPTGNMVSRVELPATWQQDADQPLVWREDAAAAAPAAPVAEAPAPVQEIEQFEPEPIEVEQIAPAGETRNQRLLRMLAAHEERTANINSEREAADNARTLQRQMNMGDAESQPRSASRRRRGAVVDVPSQTPSTPPADEETPDFFFSE